MMQSWHNFFFVSFDPGGYITVDKPPVAFWLQTSKIGGMNDINVNTDLLNYLEKNYQQGTYLFATTDANTAGPYIVKTGLSIIAMGGFTGSDPAMTIAKLQQLVDSGKVKYFLIGGMGGMGGQSNITTWIKNNCQLVPTSKWQPTSNSTSTSTSTTRGNGFRGGMNEQLYEYVGK